MGVHTLLGLSCQPHQNNISHSISMKDQRRCDGQCLILLYLKL